MDIKRKITCNLSKEDLEAYVSEKTGMIAKVKHVEIKKTGDYDRGTYKEELTSIDFILTENLPF